MFDQVRISSIDAIEVFRSDLIQYISKARVALEDMEGDVRRTRTWLDNDCSRRWMGEIKLRTKKLHQAETELYSANLTNPKASNAFYKMAVLKAKRDLVEAEEKLLVVKKWREAFENRTTPLLRQLDPMFFLVGQQLPKGVHSLGEAIKALQAYAEKSAPMNSPGPVDVPEAGGGS